MSEGEKKPYKAQESEEAVKVLVRVRPFNKRELQLQDELNAGKGEWEREPLRAVVQFFDDGTCLFLDHENDYVEKERFNFDGVMWSIPPEQQESEAEFATQETLFLDFGRPVLVQAWKGFNTCFFAYGQTGSGKSHSMMGTIIDTPDFKADPGLIPRVCMELFDQIRKAEAKDKEEEGVTRKWTVGVQYMEIYNEQVKDLLWNLSALPPDIKNKLNPENLKIRQNPTTGVFVEHLTSITANSWKECLDLIDHGNNSRATAATNMNARSSRSHAIFKLSLNQTTTTAPKRQYDKPHEHVRESYMNLVDLAGSERNKKTGATGDRLKEAASINKSLSTLKNVIDALVDNQKPGKAKKRIPYRDSHLTSILADSIGGNSKTFMLVAISPHPDNWEETLQTLKYGSRARQIVSAVHVNENAAGREMMELEEQLQRMKAKAEEAAEPDDTAALDAIRAQIAELEGKRVELEAAYEAEAEKEANLQKEKDRTHRARQRLALKNSTEGMAARNRFLDGAQAYENLTRQLDNLNSTQEAVTDRRQVLEKDILEKTGAIKEMDRERSRIEIETDALQKKLSKTESQQWDSKRKLEETDTNVHRVGVNRDGLVLKMRLEMQRTKAQNERRIATRTLEHEEQSEAQKERLKQQNDVVREENAEEIDAVNQMRENKRADLNSLKTELQRVEGERIRVITKREEELAQLQADNRKRKENLEQRLNAMAHSAEKKYNSMVLTMERQYRELMDESKKQHEYEEQKQEQALRNVQAQQKAERDRVEQEWQQRIEATGAKGKNDNQEAKNRWERQLSDRRAAMNEIRLALRDIEKRESTYSSYWRRVAATLERSERPVQSEQARKLYELLELYYGQYEDNKPNRGTLNQLLYNDINKRRCADPPAIGFGTTEADVSSAGEAPVDAEDGEEVKNDVEVSSGEDIIAKLTAAAARTSTLVLAQAQAATSPQRVSRAGTPATTTPAAAAPNLAKNGAADGAANGDDTSRSSADGSSTSRSALGLATPRVAQHNHTSTPVQRNALFFSSRIRSRTPPPQPATK